MNPLLRPAYAAAAHAARAAAALAPAGGGKLARTLRARHGVRARFAAWAAAHRDPARPLLWMHAPSVGEGLQARPVLELARARRPDLQLVYTHYSPSAEGFARALDVDYADYLPFDTAGDADALLAALRPAALVFAKLDVWPRLAERAAHAGVRQGLVSATLAAGSSRTRGIAGALLRAAYGHLDAVGAISEEDAARLVRLGVRADRLRVTGDTRYDQVWRRARTVGAAREAGGAPLLAALALPPRAARFTVVAGSTWPADERVLEEAWLAFRRQDARARLVVAPHEPTPTHLGAIERWAAAHRLSLARLGAVEGTPGGGDVDVVLVDRVGVLGELYALGDVALVGGGFHDAGLHSVLEPAAFGIPVAFGPRHTASRDAALLLAAGGALSAGTGRTLAEVLRRWRTSDALRAHAGDAARRVVEGGLGSDERAWALVEGLLGPAA